MARVIDLTVPIRSHFRWPMERALEGDFSKGDDFQVIKSSAGLAKVKPRGRARVDAAFTMALAAYNLIRLPKLLEAIT